VGKGDEHQVVWAGGVKDLTGREREAQGISAAAADKGRRIAVRGALQFGFIRAASLDGG